MGDTLASLRKAKGLTQQQMGDKILGLQKGASYAQKKIARFEAGLATPTDKELSALAKVLEIEIEDLRATLSRAPQQATDFIDQVCASGRTLMASCMMARTRPQPLVESYGSFSAAIEAGRLMMALFLPFPTSIHLSEAKFHHTNNLIGYYTRVINDVLAANLAFKNSLKANSEAVAVYAPKPELLKTSAILLPPTLRQFTLTTRQAEPPKGPITQSLHIWTPGKDVDIARPVKGNGLYSIHDQLDAWQSFFGQIIIHWIAKNELLDEDDEDKDDYWKRIR